ncbi:hypothetical protein V1264_009569 [Littorina saxatilis]|uniref:Uncharacterized protein n=2 Tax=Littorina saxatilis TaxID=31220 RepID=A0AAN9G1J3_9CAEN
MLVGGVHTIISMLRRYHDDRDILENGCRALGSFALYDETCLDVAQAGATETVLQAMNSPHNDVGVKDSCCWALACLTSIAHTCEELVSLGGVASVVETLEEFPQEETLQDYGVRIICNIGALESTLPQVSTPRVIDVLTQIHDNFPDNVELLEYMMLALSQAASVEQTVQEYFLTEGGLKTVVTVMKSLDENPAIQENGCRILGNMAVHECLRKAVEQQGASQVVLAAMLNIEMCADIHLYGCMALMNLTADLMDNKMRVKNNGAVPTLLATLRKFPDHPEVVLSALKTLGNLVDLQEACRQLLDDKGLATIVDICKDNKASDDIRSFTGLVLSGLTALPDLPIQDLLRVEETLVTLQAALPSDSDLALSMCQGLHNLMKSEIGLETLTKTGWMTVLENTTNQFQTRSEVHLTACRIVATVAMECRETSSPAKCPLSESTMRTVLHSMRLFPNDKEVQIVASAALSCVCESFENLRNAIIAEGGLTDVTTAMTNFPKDDRLHAVGLIALSYLLPVDVDTNREDAAMVISVITRSMSNFVENEHIQISACRALERCEVEGTENVFDILTCVHNGVRRHGGKKKVLKAAGRVFKRFGSDDAEEITEEMLISPTTPLGDIFVKIMKG